MLTKNWKSEVALHISDDAVTWIAENWRFYISNDDTQPYWGFVHQNGEMEMETAFLNNEAINKIIELLTWQVESFKGDKDEARDDYHGEGVAPSGAGSKP